VAKYTVRISVTNATPVLNDGLVSVYRTHYRVGTNPGDWCIDVLKILDTMKLMKTEIHNTKSQRNREQKMA
jgi:hypothetical protein